jgi:hypothetical protein
MVVRLVLIALLSGCSMTKMEHVYVDNSAHNNFVGNPCSFYLRFQGGSAQCFAMKPTPTNKDNPYKNDK